MPTATTIHQTRKISSVRALLRGCLSRWRWIEAPISAIAAKKRKGIGRRL
jgi:hypothetical protein